MALGSLCAFTDRGLGFMELYLPLIVIARPDHVLSPQALIRYDGT
jgi:hypothetical protein